VAKYKEIKYGTAFPNSNLTDFPKLISIVADTDIAAELASGGGIELYAADGTTPVPFGLYPQTNLASGTILMRVLTDVLTAASTGDTMLRLRYGAALTTVEDKSAVVANGYVLFMTLEEDPSGASPPMLDWKTNTKIGIALHSMSSGDLVSGPVGNQLHFLGSGESINIPSLAGLSGVANATIEGWMEKDSNGVHCAFGYGGGVNSRFNILWFSDGHVYCQVENGGIAFPDYALSGHARHHFALSFDGSLTNPVKATAYLNGAFTALAGGVAATTLASNQDFLIGASPGNGFSTGKIDEVKASNVTRSPEWIDYVYKDEATNTDTFSLGWERNETGIDVIQALPVATTSSGLPLESAAFPLAVTTGNTIIVVIGVYPNTEPTVTDNSGGGNIYVKDKEFILSDVTRRAYLFRATNVVGGSNFKITVSLPVYSTFSALEVANLRTIPQDGTGSGNGSTGSTTPTTGSFNTSNARDLLISFAAINDAGTTTFTSTPAGWTEFATAAVGIGLNAQFKIVSSPQTGLNPAWIISPSNIWTSIGFAYEGSIMATPRTQLHPGIFSGQRYDSFTRRPRRPSTGARTQLHPAVFSGKRYGSFAGKPEFVYVSTGNFWLYF
jgi:hypothetical protein